MDSGGKRLDRRPIGIFDSGVGGLTVLKEVRSLMPGEDIVYFGDTARVPYGPKSPETVKRYSLEIAGMLVRRGIKLLIIACNTSTAVALQAVRAKVRVPVVGVIDPACRLAVSVTSTMRIGVIGTRGTITSGTYEKRLKIYNPAVKVFQKACPLFVPLVEEGMLEGKIVSLIAEEYLLPLRAAGIDTLILGCTHYPLLRGTISKIFEDTVNIIDSAKQTALKALQILEKRHLLAPEGKEKEGNTEILVSDLDGNFRRVAELFLGGPLPGIKKIELKELEGA